MKRTWRMASSVAAMGAVTVVCVATLPVGSMTAAAQSTAPTPGGPAVAPGRVSPRADAGSFEVVHTTARPVEAFSDVVSIMTSPKAGELWVTEHQANGDLLLEHLKDGAWASETLPVEASGFRVYSGGGRTVLVKMNGDVTYVREGDRWVERVLPTLHTGSKDRARAGAVGAKGEVYVAGADFLHRLDGATWTDIDYPAWSVNSLGGPALALKVVDGQLLMQWAEMRGRPRKVTSSFHRWDGTRWSFQIRPFDDGLQSYPDVTVWVARAVDDQLLLGSDDEKPFCLQYTGGVKKGCTTSGVATRVAARADGSVVLGGASGFRLRRADGTETPIGGSVGEGLLDLQAEPGTNTVWALTRNADDTAQVQVLR